MALNSLYFLNSDPLIDFPRPSAARVIDIGGIAVSNGFNKLDQVLIRTIDSMEDNICLTLVMIARRGRFSVKCVRHILSASRGVRECAAD